jgi:hypothetical protein
MIKKIHMFFNCNFMNVLNKNLILEIYQGVWREDMLTFSLIIKSGYIRIFVLCISAIAAVAFCDLLSAGDAHSAQVTLSWYAPITNEDGSPLNDLAGHNVYYGTASGNYSQSIDTGNTTTYTVANLADGLTYYFAVTAYDTSGNESEFSDEVSKTIQMQPVQKYDLTLSKTGGGTGTLYAPGINCGADCTEAYNPGTVITLTATPDSGSVFTGWSGGGCSGSGQCVINMNADVSITATFTLQQPVAATPSSITVPDTDRDGNYEVIWGTSSTKGVTYELQEATNSSFTNGLRTVYTGTGLSASITGRTKGTTYYYRIRATKTGYIPSDWQASTNGCLVKRSKGRGFYKRPKRH